MFKHSHYRDPRGKRDRTKPRNLFKEIMAENVPNLGKETDNRSRKHREFQTR